ncbi:MazG family protein [Synoicihabitans lomoniglobus]|uniref:MazG family protein n=1 Tax=Synoicihabitans lomoniglobus TaxID=2909285 RepID=A0AAF0CRP6_9BACT|nr:MazG family protein [Opitutaceae bacterium LMO-M01]WED66784.1 MazG family protein [Opitutaceae bacterium LMO-M01]
MSALLELRETIARLRAPGGCPWDQEQTHASLVRCLIDEVSELIETIDRGDVVHMREELGDVLIQVYFHAQIAAERGDFDLDDVAREVNEKLVRRHPHVFGDEERLETSGQVLTKWEEIKAQEKKNGPPAKGLFKPQPPRLPATMWAESIWKQIIKKGFQRPASADPAAIEVKANALDDDTLGRELFILAAAARERGLDPEGALRRHASRVMSDVEADPRNT